MRTEAKAAPRARTATLEAVLEAFPERTAIVLGPKRRVLAFGSGNSYAVWLNRRGRVYQHQFPRDRLPVRGPPRPPEPPEQPRRYRRRPRSLR